MLAQNELLLLITSQLALRPPDKADLVSRFKSSQWYADRNYSPDNLFSLLSELHLRSSLEKICASFLGRVVFDPIHDGESTLNYVFRHRYGTLHVLDKSGNDYTEIDQLLIVDGIPVIFEIKLTPRKNKGGTTPNDRGINYLMTDRHIDHILAPLTEYFKTDKIGYVLIVYPSLINEGSSTQIRFLEQNGILVPFYADRMRYRTEVLALQKANGL